MKKNLLYIAAFSLALTSCLEDSGNYDYTSVAEVSIDGLTDSMRCVLLEPQNIEPQVSTNIPDSNLEYCWRIGADTLVRTKNFEYTFKTVPDNSDPLTFDILDKTTNVRYSKAVHLSVVSPFTTGLAVLCETDGVPRLDFQSFESGGKFYADAYGSINGEELQGRPVSVKQMMYTDGTTGKSVSRVSVLTQGGMSPELDGVSLERKKYYQDEFSGNGVPEFAYINAEYFGADLTMNLITTDGQVYGKVVGSISSPDDGYYEFPYEGSDGGYRLSPTLVRPRQDGIYFALDELNHCFVRWTANQLSSRITPVSFYTEGSISGVDFNTIKGRALWMGCAPYSPTFYAVVADGGKYYLYQMNYDYDGNVGFVTKMTACVQLPEGAVTDSSCFAVHNTNPYMYIGTGNRLKAINLENLQGTGFSVIDVAAFNGEITDMHFAYDANVMPTLEFYVAVSGADGSSVLQVDPALTAHGRVIKRYDGFKGRIVSFTRKML